MVSTYKVEKDALDGNDSFAKVKSMAAVAANESNAQLKALQEQIENIMHGLMTSDFVRSPTTI